MTKCPVCKECMDFYTSKSGILIYKCVLCNKSYKKIPGGKLVSLSSKEVRKLEE